MARVIHAVIVVVLLMSGVARAEYYCSSGEVSVVGVAPDGRYITQRTLPAGGADCDSGRVAIIGPDGKIQASIESSGEPPCGRWKVTAGKYALDKGDHKLNTVDFSKKIAQAIGATPLVKSTRTDLITVVTSAEENERFGEMETTAFVRWDGEPVFSVWLGNFEVRAEVSVLENPALKGFFVEIHTSKSSRSQTNECTPMQIDSYVSPADIAAHAQLVAARQAALTTPAVSAATVRTLMKAGNKDPLMSMRATRSEIAAGKKKGRVDTCQQRTRRPLGVTDSGGLIWSARTTLAAKAVCRTEERVVVEDAQGKAILRVERRLPETCDAQAERGWIITEGAPLLPDLLPREADLDAIAAIVTHQIPMTTLGALPTDALHADAHHDGIKIFYGDDSLGRLKWRTTSPASAYRVERLSHPHATYQIVRVASLPGWRWSTGGVCEDEVEDFVVVSPTRLRELAAVAAIKDASDLDEAEKNLQKYLDIKVARDAFLERSAAGSSNAICGEHLKRLYRLAKGHKSAAVRAFAVELCGLDSDNACDVISAACTDKGE